MPLFDTESRQALRQRYVQAWYKYRTQQPLEPLEAQIAAVVADHPEYHALLEAGDAALEAEFHPELGRENPFLHMGLHLALREQVSTDRPAGIAAIHAKLTRKLNSALEAEHRLIELLAETLWEAQRSGQLPDEKIYLARAERLAD